MELVPPRIAAVMADLEEQDRRDREDGTPRSRRLRAVSPEVGRLLATLVVSSGARSIVEVGTSGGYSTLWFAVGAARTGGRIVTFEVDPAKIERARATFAAAGVEERVELRHEDGVRGMAAFGGSADLVFLDAEKELYESMLEPAVAALRPGGLLVADNLVSHEQELEGFRRAALAHERLFGVVVPLGGGELIAVRT